MSAFYSFIQLYIGSVSVLLYVYYILQENEKVVAEEQVLITGGTSWERFQRKFWLTIETRKWNSVEGVFNTCVYVFEALLLISFLATIIYNFVDRASIVIPNFGVSNLGSSITQRARSSANTALEAMRGNQMPNMTGIPSSIADMKKIAGGTGMPSMPSMSGMPSMTGMPSMAGLKNMAGGMKIPGMKMPSGMKIPGMKK